MDVVINGVLEKLKSSVIMEKYFEHIGRTQSKNSEHWFFKDYEYRTNS